MDTIADYLTMIRNAAAVGHDTVDIPNSKMKLHLSELLKKEGYIEGFSVEDRNVGSAIKIVLKYSTERAPAISGIKRISKPGCRVYAGYGKIPRVLGGMGTAVISSSNGIITGHDARKQGVGGEVVAYVW